MTGCLSLLNVRFTFTAISTAADTRAASQHCMLLFLSGLLVLLFLARALLLLLSASLLLVFVLMFVEFSFH